MRSKYARDVRRKSEIWLNLFPAEKLSLAVLQLRKGRGNDMYSAAIYSNYCGNFYWMIPWFHVISETERDGQKKKTRQYCGKTHGPKRRWLLMKGYMYSAGIVASCPLLQKSTQVSLGIHCGIFTKIAFSAAVSTVSLWHYLMNVMNMSQVSQTQSYVAETPDVRQ